MQNSVLEHIRTQAITVARYLNSETAGRGLINNALREHPGFIPESIECFEASMRGLARVQIQKWIDQGYNILLDGVPHRTFGDLWAFLDRLDEEDDHVIVLEDIANWSDSELAGFWDAQRSFRSSPK